MSLLEDFAIEWGLKVDGERISSPHGFIMEHQGLLWIRTHSYSPNGHVFFPITDWAAELKALAIIKLGLC
jgi:hypothetical protein